jgi:hypothetical protein
MAITLSDDEIGALRKALDSYLPELRFEMSRIKLPSDRLSYVELEEKLSAVRQKLG